MKYNLILSICEARIIKSLTMTYQLQLTAFTSFVSLYYLILSFLCIYFLF